MAVIVAIISILILWKLVSAVLKSPSSKDAANTKHNAWLKHVAECDEINNNPYDGRSINYRSINDNF